MADTLVERLTGRATAGDVAVELQILMPLEALGDPTSTAAATLLGHGPLPAPIATDILRTTNGRRWWRRLFTSRHGLLPTGDARRRCFDRVLATLIAARDHTCRDPYCHAPIRHHDHIARWADGGPTTFDNGRGVCERGNHVRETPGWHVTVLHTGLDGHPTPP